MDTTSWIIIGVVACIGIGGAIALYHYRKKSMTKLFHEVYANSRQVPKQKRKSFLLLMFKESLSNPKNKNKSMANLSNPKYVEVQLLQMSRILKDPSKVKDKTMKRSLAVLDEYMKWEKEQNSGEKTASKSK